MTLFALHRKYHGRILLFSLFTLFILSIIKDLLHATAKEYNFYLSESMLFSLHWLLFIPVIMYMRNHDLLKSKKVNRRFLLFTLPFLFTVCHIFMYSLLVYALSALFFDHSFSIRLLIVEALADHSLSTLLIYFAALYFLRQPNKTSVKKEGIRVHNNSRTLVLSFKDIIYITSERPYIAIVAGEGRFLHDTSLKSIGEQLPEHFIRIHKSTLINTRQIRSYTSRKNGDYDVIMTNGDTVRVSRNFNDYFRSYSRNSG